MERKTELSKTLVNAYRTTHYRVLTGSHVSFILKIKKKSADLEEIMRRDHLFSAAYLTAYNPKGQQVALHLNLKAQKHLLGDIRRTGLPFLEGFGEDSTGRWKKEPSFLVLGLSIEVAEDLGRKYAQNAIVWVEEDFVPRLVMLR